ncbi:winged helix-turn-helix domain-containing protein [Sphingomonas rhizophila]|uniref:Winged helix-turn-helix domain-containing protein n=1 Tax=Sphingomonas rhizophila TaxID=2071607 RepID=A0A7G9S9F0_9SPHN|nr:winged helix-turn-helix domain-containing protein [Sphingomonas rhizophila]QNN64475.1 winged helix-turn-helix domain-containing protein [Sphingomonas rhizophila]
MTSHHRLKPQERHRWCFGRCVFDEQCWTLTVDGRRVAIECKPLEILSELLLNAGSVVTKAELLDRIWPDVTVVEASLPTAIRKLRLAIGDCRPDLPMIETVTGIGYRFAAPVREAAVSSPVVEAQTPARAGKRQRLFLSTVSLGLAALVGAGGSQFVSSDRAVSPPSPYSAEQRAQIAAMRKLDVPALESMLAAGWNPNELYERGGPDALQYLLNICEWDPQHDRRKALLAARTLIDANDNIFYRNRFGDTAYSIAKADRYCGPDHPVTQMLHRICASGVRENGNRCMATYALERGERF